MDARIRIAPAPLIMLGHPGGLHKMYPRLVARARHSAAHEATSGPVLGAASVVMSRREFEQRRWADKERTPGNRCC